MGLIDLVAVPGQQIAYLFPEVVSTGNATVNQTSSIGGSGSDGLLRNVFVFQFWPSQVQDSYQVNYATKQIPGASHPLYQWVGGNGRTLSFEAQFVSELDESVIPTDSFNARVARSAATGILGGAANAVSAALLPSSRYVVDVAGAVAALQQYLYGTYNDVSAMRGITKPPAKLYLVLPNTSLGRAEGDDAILCIMLRADVTHESWFPSGRLRAAKVALEFAEIVQHTDGEGSSIRYIGADAYSDLAGKYLASGTGFNKLTI